MSKYNADYIRKSIPGFVGGKEIADKATDIELCILAECPDKLAELHNTGLEYKKREARILKQIKGR